MRMPKFNVNNNIKFSLNIRAKLLLLAGILMLALVATNLNRDKLRYPSADRCGMGAYRAADPAGQARRRKRRVAIREVINGVHSEHRLPVARAARICRPEAPCMITSACGTGTARWIASNALYLKCREKAAREASPTACIIDSQSVKSAEKGGLASTATASMPAS